MSVVILLFAAISLVRMTISLFTVGFKVDPAQVGVSPKIAVATMIVIFVINLLLLLPQVYVGVKGIKIAKEPTYSKTPSVWAVILLVFAAFGVISAISNISKQVNVVDNIFVLADHAIDVALYFFYVKYLNKVLKGE
jgi:hypothetical protein